MSCCVTYGQTGIRLKSKYVISIQVLDFRIHLQKKEKACAYLIFVISFTLARHLNPNILHPKSTKSTQKLQQIVQKSVKCEVFRVQF